MDHQQTTLSTLAEAWHQEDGFVWLDSLKAEASEEPATEGLSIIAHEPEFFIEGNADEWPLLEKKLAEKKVSSHSTSPGAAIGFFRYDGSFCFGFYKKVLRCNSFPREDFLKKNHPPSQHSTESLTQQIPFVSNLSKEEYCRMIRKAQQEIAAGNIYQVCLAHRFEAPFKKDPWLLYQQLRKISPAPFAAYLNFKKETVLSSSPECFLKIEDRHILTRPIKGTRPRHSSTEADALQAMELQQSLKENAELIMITDLERNDLGKVCNYGSVVTSQLVHLEPYPHVFHLISTVEGTLRPEVSHVAAVAACFPGGSISGAPKKMAMKIIDELEPSPRRLFTGAIGYFGYDGNSQFNIAIRTVIIQDDIASFHVGAGITSDSIPEQEWQETLDKAKGLLGLKFR